MSKVDELADLLDAAIGENAPEQEVSHWLDTGYKPLNAILSGNFDRGFPGGRIIEIFGPSSSGKTLLATLAMIAAQKQGGIAAFNDHEYTFQMPFAKSLGLSDDRNKWVYKRPETWEQSNTIAMKGAEVIRNSKLIPDNAPIVWVFDSVAAMIPRSQIYDSKGKGRSIEETNMNDTTALSRVSSTTLKVVNQLAAELNVTMIYLNQIRTKPGVVYGDPTTTPGGSSMEFYASQRLALGRKIVREEVDGEKEVVANITGITTKKNKLARFGQEADIRLSFDKDTGVAYFDFHTSLIDYLLEHKKLVLAGARITWTDGKQYYKKQLAEKLRAEPSGLTQLEAFLLPTLAAAA